MIASPQRSAGNGPEKAGPEVAARLSRLVRDLRRGLAHCDWQQADFQAGEY